MTQPYNAEAKYSDYSQEDLEKWDKLCRDNSKRIMAWGVNKDDKTYYIPFEHITLNHAKNIVDHIKRNRWAYDTGTLYRMDELYKKKLKETTENGILLYENE